MQRHRHTLHAIIPLITVLLLLPGCSKKSSGNNDHTDTSRTDNGYFDILLPQEHDHVHIDSLLDIQWNSSDSIDLKDGVSITLFKDSVEIGTIDTGDVSEACISDLLHRAGSGDGYRIRVRSLSDTTQFDFSGEFSLYSDYSGTITVTAPDTSARIMLYAFDTVSWKSTGNPGSTVRIDLYRDNAFVTTLDTGISLDSGVYEWNSIYTPLGSGGHYQLKVTSEEDGSLYGYSIVFPIESKYQGEFIFRNPGPSASWVAGDTQTIRWDTTGDPGDHVTIELLHDTTLLTKLTRKPLTKNSGSFIWRVPPGMTTDSVYRIRITSDWDASISTLSDPIFIKGIDTDRYEPDNIPDAALPITSRDDVYTRTITIEDTDWFTFTADSGTCYLVRAGIGDSLQLTCTLFMEGADSVLVSKRSQNIGLFTWIWKCEYNGNYTMKLSGVSDSSVGSYSFTVFSYDSLSSLVFSSPTEHTLWLHDSTVTIRWIPDTLIYGASAEIQLYRLRQHLTTLHRITSPAENSFEWTIPDSFTSSSKYQIKIADRYHPELCGYSPLFTLSNKAPDDFEPDNTPEHAGTLTLGTPQVHTISFQDTDCVAFDAVKDSVYLIHIESPVTFRFKTTIVSEADSSGEKLLSPLNDNGRSSLRWVCPASGMWVITIIAQRPGSTGAYYCSVQKFNPQTTASFISPIANDIWQTDSTVTIQWQPDTAILGTAVRLSLYNKDNIFCRITASTPNSGTYAWNVPSNTGSGSGYRIRIAVANDTAVYGMSLPFSIQGMAPDTFESDNTHEDAHPYIFGTTEEHTITLNDCDILTFNGIKDSSYTIRITGADTFHTEISIWHAAAISPVNTISCGTDGTLLKNWKCTQTGDVFVHITAAADGTGGAYHCLIEKFIPPETVKFISPEEGDVVADPVYISVQWVPDTSLLGTDVYIYLYKGSSLIAQNIRATNSGIDSVRITERLVTGSDYYLRLVSKQNIEIYGISPHFTIQGIDPTHDSYENDNTFDLATPITPGTVQLHNLLLDDNDWLSLPVTAGKQYIVCADSVNNRNDIRALIYYGDTASHDFNTVFNRTTPFRYMTKDTTATCLIALWPEMSGILTKYRIHVLHYDSSIAVRVTSPPADSAISAGTKVPVCWTDPADIIQNVNITLLHGDDSITSLNKTNDTMCIFTISESLSGDSFRFRVRHESCRQLPVVFSPSFSITPFEPSPPAPLLDIATSHRDTLQPEDTCTFRIPVQSGYGYLFKTVGFSISDDITVKLQGSTSSSFANYLRNNTISDTTWSWWICRKNDTCSLQIFGLTEGAYTLRYTQYDTTKIGFLTSEETGNWQADSYRTFTWTCDTSLFGQRVRAGVSGPGYSATTSQNTVEGSGEFKLPFYAENGSRGHAYITSTRNSELSIRSEGFTVTGGLEHDSFEPDNTPSNATLFTLGTTQEHTLLWNDTDFVKFDADSGVSYLFTEKVTTGNSNGSDSKFYYENGNTLELVSITSNNWNCTKTGTYYRRMMVLKSPTRIGTPGRYTLKIEQNN